MASAGVTVQYQAYGQNTYPHSASCQCVQATGRLSGQPEKMLGSNLRRTNISSRETCNAASPKHTTGNRN